MAGFNPYERSYQKKLDDLLSGGERNRVRPACELKLDANVILADGPTSDLVGNYLSALKDVLGSFAGSCDSD